MQHLTNPVDIINDIGKFDLNLRGDSFLLETAKFLYKTLDVCYVMIARKGTINEKEAVTSVLLKNGEVQPEISYSLEGTPCENVFDGQRVCIYSPNAVEAFPKDRMLAREGLISYAGSPILLPDNSLYGILTILDTEPLQDLDELTTVLDFAAARIGVEMAKEIHEQEMLIQTKKLEDLVNQRTEELHKVIVELEKAQNQVIAQEKLASIGEISVGMAHEVKNPMNHIVNATEIIEQFFKDNQPREDTEETKEMVEIILESCHRIDKTIKTILEKGEPLSSFQHHKSSNTTMLNLAPALRTIPEFITLAKSIEEAEIDVPIQEIERILINIIDNAKHTLKERSIYETDQTYKPLLTILGYVDKDDYIFEIKDNGMGMREKVRTQIFKPFFTTKQKFNSTGLGLGLVQEVLSKYNGRIDVESEYHAGSIFKITVPLTDAKGE